MVNTVLQEKKEYSRTGPRSYVTALSTMPKYNVNGICKFFVQWVISKII